jgi:hypothetical protein
MGSSRSRETASRKLKTRRFRNKTWINIVLYWKTIDKVQGKTITSFSHIPHSEPYGVERLGGVGEYGTKKHVWKKKRKEFYYDAGENCVMRNCTVCMSRRISLWWSLQGRWNGRIDGSIEVTGRRARNRKQLLDNLKERRGCWKLKEEALDRTLWRTRFGRGYGPVVR